MGYTSLRSTDIEGFLQTLYENPDVLISEAHINPVILSTLNLTGKEERPLKKSEIKIILNKYKFYKTHFHEKGLWPE